MNSQNLVDIVNSKFSKFIDVNFGVGDTVEVHCWIKDGEKERIQVFKGDVISIRKGKSFTVRKISSNVGVEKIFPLNSPLVEKVECVREGKVRRAKLYYLRDKKGKAAKIKAKAGN